MIRAFILAALVVLAGCAVKPTPSLSGSETVQVIGRVSLTHDGRRDAGGFDYRGSPTQQSWTLYGPTGTRVGELSAQSTGARWTPEDGPALQADNLDELVMDAIGVAAPLASAKDWLFGRVPAGALPTPAGFTLRGWELRWLKYNDTGQPRLIEMTRGTTRIRLVAKTWQ